MIAGPARSGESRAKLWVVAERWLKWVEVGQLADKRDEIEKSFESARRDARRGVSR